MAKKMKAAFVEKFGEPLQVRELPVPDPGSGAVLVSIVASGVCHTDLHAAEGDWPVKPSPPFIPGHEGAGFVAKLGPGVKHLKEGDRVGIAWLHTRVRCPKCKATFTPGKPKGYWSGIPEGCVTADTRSSVFRH